jgi:hypothetical protein
VIWFMSNYDTFPYASVMMMICNSDMVPFFSRDSIWDSDMVHDSIWDSDMTHF